MHMLFTQPIEQRINEMIAGIRGDVGVKVFGEDFGKLTQCAGKSRPCCARFPERRTWCPISWP